MDRAFGSFEFSTEKPSHRTPEGPCNDEWWAHVALLSAAHTAHAARAARGTSALALDDALDDLFTRVPDEAVPGVSGVVDGIPESPAGAADGAARTTLRAADDAGAPGNVSYPEDSDEDTARTADSRDDLRSHTRGAAESDTPTDGDTTAGHQASWPFVVSIQESASALATMPPPESAAVCLAEAQDLLFARDRLTSAIAARVRRVHAAGEAKAFGHASTKTWLRGAAGMTTAGAGRLVGLATELDRLPTVRDRFAQGSLSEGQVTAICAATGRLTDAQAALAEPILVALADQATPTEVARAGRYLHEVLNPDSAEDEADADYQQRFLLVRESSSGGLEGEFRLPREAGARLRALLDTFAKPKAEGDDRPLRVRNADALIALLEQQVTTELLVLVNAASLPDDPQPTEPCGNPQPTEGHDAPEPTEGYGSPATASPATGSSATAPPTSPAAFSPSAAGPTTDSADHDNHGDSQRGTVTSDGRQTDEAGSGRRPTNDSAMPSPLQAPPPQAPPLQASPLQASPLQASPLQASPPQTPPGKASAAYAPSRKPASTPLGKQHRNDPSGGERPLNGSPPSGSQRDRSRSKERMSGWALPAGLMSGRRLPGLLLATGQFLPVSDIHRLARTSSLARLVMNAESEILDMGRKVRRATAAQRRTILARYTSCMVDDCSLPAHLCQIDHIDNWSDGGATDLDKLGPTCQFHNRDRYRHPERYRLYRVGKDRWAFAYLGPRPARRT
ncbi:HNH endonuclease [Microtetraspora sp. NBRC 16547]|uniref:HNH endonuclease signature motif containing protein n=1 Tax=Microtetraspora sp. NBRC 16547 TaxID=3030993 RepID=UPI0024A37B41|nr:HNH endonuclease [Microtetraspora sp. NBRC 16547]GLX00165.1 hypothetical protein Misp02_42510 [Microtetraspora sp. NBRC 16547]